MWSRIKSPRPIKRAVGGFGLGHGSVASSIIDECNVNVGIQSTAVTHSDISIASTATGPPGSLFDKDGLPKMTTVQPPRYRFRDLLLGDFAFNDDGERLVLLLSSVFFFIFFSYFL